MHGRLLPAFIFVAFIGFVDASYLAFNAVMNIATPCVISEGCDAVTTSAYSRIFGIPVAILGAAYYLAVFVASARLWQVGDMRIARFMPLLTAIGLVASVWFVSVQAFVLKAWCSFCLLSAFTSTLLFIMSWKVRALANDSVLDTG
jgi:uncharacterized membrane protein